MKVIAVIPARGGSKGIPRKCIRPVNGKPMLWYAVRACLACESVDRVIVSTEDEEIALLAERFGALFFQRPEKLADDETPLDPVIRFAVEQAETELNERYDLVLTVQPTSPLVQPSDIAHAVELLSSKRRPDTVISVVDDRHLSWKIINGEAVPAYAERVNRQKLPARYRETGAVIGCQRDQLQQGSRVGQKVALLEIPASRSVDIDTVADLAICESLMSRKRITFAVLGYPEVGLGHAYRALMLAHEFVQWDVTFICEDRSALAIDFIERHNYAVVRCRNGDIYEAIRSIEPHVVVNDILDTSYEYIKSLKALGCAVVNFEDLGTGRKIADLVVNALYGDENGSAENELWGPNWFCLRDEFVYLPERDFSERVKTILVTFGGTDANNLTVRVTHLLLPVCLEGDIKLEIVVGPGYQHHRELEELLRDSAKGVDVTVFSGTARISDMMFRADMAVTSGGRTVYELAAVRVPTVVLCQNERELRHSFARVDNGVINLGHHLDVEDDEISHQLATLVRDTELRASLKKRQSKWDFKQGKRRIFDAITALLK